MRAATTMRVLSIALAGAMLPLASACAQSPYPAETYAGCYEVAGGLPDGFQVSFCLTAALTGEFTSIGPTGVCVRSVNWALEPGSEPTPIAWPSHYIHLNVNWFSVGCPDHAAVLTDDIYCDLAPGGLACTFDEESGPRSYTVPRRDVVAYRVN